MTAIEKNNIPEETALLWHIGGNLKERQPDRKTILMGLRDPGETNAFIPVIETLMEDPEVDLFVLADGYGQKSLDEREFRKSREFDPLLRVSSLAAHARVVLTGVSELGGTESALTLTARGNGVPVVWLEDYPGNIFPHLRRNSFSENIQPDYLLAVNNWAKEREVVHCPSSFDPNRILVTGQPSFDRFSEECALRPQVQADIRSQFGIEPDEKLIVFMGTDTPDYTPQTLETFISGMETIGFKDYRFALRLHPRDETERSSYKELTQPIQEHLIDTSGINISTIGLAADLVVNINSTEGLVAVYRGISSLHMLLENVVGPLSEDNLPQVVQDGSSALISTGDEVAPVLQKLFFDNEYQHELAERMSKWKMDSGATERVVDIVKRVVNGETLV